jgi:hypothetical protein
MDNKINSTKAKIDAEVINAYGFERSDAKTILDSVVDHSEQRQRTLTDL